MPAPNFGKFISSRRDFSLWVVGFFVVIGLTTPFLYSYIYRQEKIPYQINQNGLSIPGMWDGVTVSAAHLKAESARVVNLKSEKNLVPVSRIDGINGSHYKGGLYQLRNGRKARIAIGDETQVAYIPTDLDFDVLFSIHENSGEFLRKIRKQWGR